MTAALSPWTEDSRTKDPQTKNQGPRFLNPRTEDPQTEYPRIKDPRIEDPVHGLEFCRKIYTLMFCTQNKTNQIYLHNKYLQFEMLHTIWTS